MAKDDGTAPKAPTQYVLGADDLKTLLVAFKEAAGSPAAAPGMPDDPIGREAHPRPTMIYDYEFCHGRVLADWLTIPEIELINQFTADKTARDGQWTATISRNGTKKKLQVEVPYRGLDTRHDLPSQAAILIELLYGETIADPASALVLIQQLQAKVNQLESRLATANAAS